MKALHCLLIAVLFSGLSLRAQDRTVVKVNPYPPRVLALSAPEAHSEADLEELSALRRKGRLDEAVQRMTQLDGAPLSESAPTGPYGLTFSSVPTPSSRPLRTEWTADLYPFDVSTWHERSVDMEPIAGTVWVPDLMAVAEAAPASGGKSHLTFLVSSDHGETWGTSEMNLSAPVSLSHARLSQVAADAVGTVYEWETSATNHDIYFIGVGKDLSPTTDSAVDASSAHQVRPSITSDYTSYPTAAFAYVVYYEVTGATSKLLFRWSSDEGASWSAAKVLDTFDTPDFPHTSISILNNLLVAAYTKKVSGSDNVSVAYSTSFGIAWSLADVATAAANERYPEVTAAYSGEAWVTWELWYTGTDRDVWTAYTADWGATWDGYTAVTNSTNDERFPSIGYSMIEPRKMFLGYTDQTAKQVLVRSNQYGGSWSAPTGVKSSANTLDPSGRIALVPKYSPAGQDGVAVAWSELDGADYDVGFDASWRESAAGPWTLNVQSTPPTGVSITGTPSTYSGTTNYTKTGISDGTSLSLTAPATDPPGTTWSNWLCTNPTLTQSAKTVSVTLSANRTCTAIYGETRTLVIESLPQTGLAITANPSVYSGTTKYTTPKIPLGTVIALSVPAVDPDGLVWDAWICSNPEQTETSKTISVTVSDDRVCTAGYQTAWSLIVESPPLTGVPITGTPSVYSGHTKYLRSGIPDGTVLSLTAPADDPAGYVWDAWICWNPEQTEPSKTITITMEEERLCTAAYTKTWTLLVESKPYPGIAITGTPSAFGGTTTYAKQKVPDGTSVTLTVPATDPTGIVWDAWTCTNPTESATSKSIAITVSDDRLCTASYQPAWTLLVESVPIAGLAITANPSTYGGTTTYAKTGIADGTALSLTAPGTDPDGLTWEGWTCTNPAQTEASKTVSLTMNDDRLCTAGYATAGPNPPIVAVKEPPGFEIYPGEMFCLSVRVGTVVDPVSGLYAVDFTVNYPPAKVSSAAPPEPAPGPFLADADVSCSADPGAGTRTCSVSATTGSGSDGYGTVLQDLCFIVDPGLSPGEIVAISLSDVAAVGPTPPGTAVPLDPISTDLTVAESTFCVWPGDTNADGTVDQQDVLPIGLAWGHEGPPRPPDRLGCRPWECKAATPWLPEAATHADADGNGRVSAAEVLCIGLNWGNTPTSVTPLTPAKATGAGRAGLLVLETLDSSDDRVIVSIRAEEALGVLGTSFVLSYPSGELVVESARAGGWLGEPLLTHSWVESEKGQVSMGLARLGEEGAASGDGELAVVSFHRLGSEPLGPIGLREATASVTGGDLQEWGLSERSVLVAREEAALPAAYALEGGYPNPFNPATTIAFQIPEPAAVVLEIFDVMGHQARRLLDGPMEGGRHHVRWDSRDDSGRPVASGTYLVRMRSGSFAGTCTVTLTK